MPYGLLPLAPLPGLIRLALQLARNLFLVGALDAQKILAGDLDVGSVSSVLESLPKGVAKSALKSP